MYKVVKLKNIHVFGEKKGYTCGILVDMEENKNE